MTEITSAIDSHAHCGIQDTSFAQGFEDYWEQVRGSAIEGAVFFAPVMEIYDRYDPNFSDTPSWRKRRARANEYLLGLDSPSFRVIPYFFIWNDFAVEQLTPEHKGIKWHRHADEPVYQYDDPLCEAAVDEIRARNMPILLEEELENTLFFIRELAVGVRIIIPHLGFLNGGYGALKDAGIWSEENVFTDTSLAPRIEILDYISRFGSERILFGSDFPFGSPVNELSKIETLPLPDTVKANIGKHNLLRLLDEVETPYS